MSKISIAWAVVKGWFLPGTSAFEQVVDLALNCVNNAINQSNIMARIQSITDVARKALDVVVKYQRYCPPPWAAALNETIVSLRCLIGVTDDGVIQQEEVIATIRQMQIAYSRWMAD